MKNSLYETLDFSESYDFFFKSQNDLFFAIGPCALENMKMALDSIKLCESLNIKFFRSFIYKSRTKVYSFQGLQDQGIEIIKRLKSDFPSIRLICEITSITQYDKIKEYIDVFQIGARSMYNTELLSFLGNKNQPIILKRHFGATIYEWLNMAEYYLYNGGRKIILCERGIRSFETSYRFSFDILSAGIIKKFSNIPVIADPSHPSGDSSLVQNLSMASIAAGFQGLIIETHPEPENALSDNKQQLSHDRFIELFNKISKIRNDKL